MSGKPSYAHDFGDVIDHHAEQERRQRNPLHDVFQTHPLERGEDESKGGGHGGIYQTDKYDYVPHYEQFCVADEIEQRDLEALMQRIVEGDGVLRKEQYTTDPRGNFNVLIVWLERVEKKTKDLKKKP